MVRVVDASWLRSRLNDPGFRVVDPRSRLRYTSGHVPGAISVPIKEALQSDARLLSDHALVEWLGRRGVPSQDTVVLYADSDGQSASMMAWILDYLGHPDVVIVGTRFERWTELGGELSYRPIEVAPTEFDMTRRHSLRATWEDASEHGTYLIDARSPAEYRGEQVVADDRPGHIPGAINLPWLSFQGGDGDLLASNSDVDGLLRRAGTDSKQDIVVYCRSGPRASLVWLAVTLTGGAPRLYDGSFLDWSRRSQLAVESEPGPSPEDEAKDAKT